MIIGMLGSMTARCAARPVAGRNPQPTIAAGAWRARLNGDPLPWLLDQVAPAVRHRALRELLDRPADNSEVVEARARAMTSDPIATILAAQDPEGWWVYSGRRLGTQVQRHRLVVHVP